jgi:hypothetical protein
MLIIPYDMDRGLGVNTWNPSGHGMTEDDPFSKRAFGSNSDQKNPLFLKTVCTGGMFIDEYIEALKEVSGSSMLTPSRFEASFNIASALYSGEATPSKKYDNASGHKFYFDINRTCNKKDSKNMSFSDYITAKQNTLARYLGTGGSGNEGGNTPITNARPYIMGDMNGWQVNSSYEMQSTGEGIFTFTLTSSMATNNGKIKFKLFDNSNSTWYGGEIIDKNCTVSYDDNNGNRNIYLAPGKYLVTFDANTVTLYLEKIG